MSAKINYPAHYWVRINLWLLSGDHQCW